MTVTYAEVAVAAPRATRVARVRVGAYTLAVDAQLVEQVLSEPLPLVPLPCAPAHVPGAVRIRDSAVPLLDIAALFGRPGTETAPPLTMVVRHPRGRFAVRVDELMGLFTAKPEQYSEIDVQHGSTDGVFSHLFCASGIEIADVVLDVEAIARVGELHSSLAPHHAHAHRRVELGSTFFVVEAGARRIAFAAAHVRHVQAHALLDRVTFEHQALLGFYQLGAERIAVIELAAVLGLPTATASTRTRALIVLDDERGAPVAFAVSSILDMERFAEEAIRTLADDDGRDHPIWRGTYPSERHGTVLVADTRAVWHMGTLVDTRSLFANDGVGANETGEPSTPIAHMVYRVAGGLLASRVCDARAVIALPADFVDLRGTGNSLVGLFTHKQRTVQVLDLASLMGRDAVVSPIGKPILVLTTQRGLLGLLVDEVLCMRSAVPTRIPGASRRPYGIIPAFAEMVCCRLDSDEWNVTVLDLDALGDYGDLMQLMGALES